MKAVVYDGKGSVKLSEVAKPKIIANKDAIVRVTHASICGSDLNILPEKSVKMIFPLPSKTQIGL